MHLMLDLETFARSSNARVVQVACVPFQLNGKGAASSYQFNQYIRFDPRGDVEKETTDWWMEQGEAWVRLRDGMQAGQALHEVVKNFISWYKTMEFLEDLDGIWSYGAAFDLPIWQTAIERGGEKKPWNYHLECCLRTIGRLHPFDPVTVDTGFSHDALNDCHRQILQLQSVYNQDCFPKGNI